MNRNPLIPIGSIRWFYAAFFCMVLMAPAAVTRGQDGTPTFDPRYLEEMEIIRGVVENIEPLPLGLPGQRLVLDTASVVFNNDTRFLDTRGGEIPVTGVKKGDSVIVGALESHGVKIALVVVKLDDENHDRDKPIEGRITEVIDIADQGVDLAARFPGLLGMVVIERHTLLVFDRTSITLDGEEIPLGKLKPGYKVHAKTQLHDEVNLPEAVSIKVLDTGDHDHPRFVEVKGRIQHLELYSNTFSDGLDRGDDTIAGDRGLIRVEDIFFNISSKTVIKDKAGHIIPATALSVGDRVHLKGEDVGMLTVIPQAYHIRLLDDSSTPPRVAFTGKVHSIDPDARSFMVDAPGFPRPTPGFDHPPISGIVKVVTNDETVFVTPLLNRTVGFDDLVVGEHVGVEGIPHDAKTDVYLAEKVIITTLPQEPTIVVQGEIEAIRSSGDNAIEALRNVELDEPHRIVVTVRGVDFFVTDETKVHRGNQIVRPDVLEVGMVVRVEALVGDGPPHHAQTIHIKPDLPPTPKPVVLSGAIESVDSDSRSLVVRGMRVLVDESTVILGVGPSTVELTFDDLTEGSLVRVAGFARDQNTVLAKQIRVMDAPPTDGNEVAWRGRITRIDEENRWFNLGDTRRVVEVVNSTEIKTSNGRPLTFEDLKEGQLVGVKGVISRNDSTGAIIRIVTAERIIVHVEGPVEGKVRGEIRALTARGWLVEDTNVVLTSETVFASADRERLDVTDFSEGDIVAAHGVYTEDRELIARLAVLLRTGGDEPMPLPEVCVPDIALGGVVENMDHEAMTFTVKGRTVTITSATRIYRDGDGPVRPGELADGMTVYIRGMRVVSERASFTGGLTACLIRIQGEWDRPPREHQVSGRVEAVNHDESMFYVRDLRVNASEARIVDRRGDPLEFEVIEPGVLVHAQGFLTSVGILDARVVKVLAENFVPRPEPVHVMGRLDVDPGPDPVQLVIDGEEVPVTDDTQYVDVLKQPMNPADLAAGDAVRVLPGRDGAPMVLLVGEILVRHDRNEGILRTNLGPARYSSETVFIDRTGGEDVELDPATLVLGDLLRVRLPIGITDEFPPTATLVELIRTSERSGEVPPFAPVRQETEDGRPVLEIADPGAWTYGFVSLPLESGFGLPNTLYELEMEVSSNVTDRQRVPTSRIRMNRSDFSRGAVLEIAAAGSRQHLPTTEGVRHRLFFVPEALSPDPLGSRGFFPSFDLLNTDPNVEAGSRMRIDDMELRPISMDRVRVVGTLHRSDFTRGTEGWQFGAIPELFAPARHGMEPGGLSMAPSGEVSYGYWDSLLEARFRPGGLYRGRFLLRSTTENRAGMPTVRVRLNTERFEFGSTVNIERLGRDSDAPGPTPRYYDVYLYIPEDMDRDGRILAALDLLSNTSDIDQDAGVVLEEFVLEEITIDP